MIKINMGQRATATETLIWGKPKYGAQCRKCKVEKWRKPQFGQSRTTTLIWEEVEKPNLDRAPKEQSRAATVETLTFLKKIYEVN